MPTPGRLNISSRAFSRTGTGSTAGPALKLKILSVISSLRSREPLTVNRDGLKTCYHSSRLTVNGSRLSNFQQAQLDYVFVRRLQLFERGGGRRGFEVDARDRGLR